MAHDKPGRLRRFRDWLFSLEGASTIIGLIGFGPMLSLFASLTSILAGLRTHLFVAPDLAVLYAFLLTATAAFFLLAVRAYLRRRRGDFTYRKQSLLWPVAFTMGTLTIYFIPGAYQSGLRAWEPKSKTFTLRLEASGKATVSYSYRVVSHQRDLCQFVMDVPVLQPGHPAASDSGTIGWVNIAGHDYVLISLRPCAHDGEERTININTEYDAMFTAQTESVSLRVDNFYDEVTMQIFFPSAKRPKAVGLYLFYLQSYEAIAGSFLSQDRLLFSFRKRNTPFAWIPYGGIYRVEWTW